MEIDTFNKFFVGVQGRDTINILNPPSRITKAEALTFAAWLVTLADDDDKFPAVLEAVQNT